MVKSHLRHVVEHLERVRSGHTVTPNPDAVYLGGEEGEYFWELVGMRLVGCPVVVLAALRFRRHDLPGIDFARESLATYLFPPPAPRNTEDRGMIPALLPNARERIPTFLSGLRAGRAVAPVYLDPAHIEVAFDFRMHNPWALESVRRAVGPLRSFIFRTRDGHLLRGQSRAAPGANGFADGFVAIQTPVQLVGANTVPLPTLIVRRSYLGLIVDVTDEGPRLAAQNWLPFLPATASQKSILPLPGYQPSVA
jgi:hypothetical protein